jgi:TolB protein
VSLRRPRLLACLTAALVLTPALAQATTPGKNGFIAFYRYRLQDDPLWSEIYVANPDGTGARRVSSSPTAIEDKHPQWSPDGRRLLFDRCTTNICTIWIVDADGAHQRRLTAACPSDRPPPVCSDDTCPSFAPDGRHFVFARVSGRIEHQSTDDWAWRSEIVWRDLRGGRSTVLRRLTGFRGDYEQPQVSPDGTRLLFRIENSDRARPKNGKALFVANLDGSGQQRITPWSLRATSTAAWAPDGSRILFASDLPAGHLAPGTNLYTVRPDGTGLRRLTNVGANHYVLAGSYSPDGKEVVYATDLDATPKPDGNAFADIVTMPLAGGPVTHVTHSPNLDGWPAWGGNAR